MELSVALVLVVVVLVLAVVVLVSVVSVVVWLCRDPSAVVDGSAEFWSVRLDLPVG
jgi:hypothetical protein